MDVSGNVDTVRRRLKGYEYFRVDLNDKKTIKIVVAEKPLQDNSLVEILKHKDFADNKLIIPYAVGFDDMGGMCIEDIIDFPHLLLAGTTRSGKSTAMISLLASIAYKHRTGNVNVMILDILGKTASDFEIFDHQPFLSCPVIKDPEAGLAAILRLDEEMRNRKKKDISLMPYIVCVVDEFPRLFTDIDDKEAKDRLENALIRLMSGGRHMRIHMVLAAQDPSKKHMVCGIGNLSARMAFKCAHYQNSVVILGKSDAHNLSGNGQLIFQLNGDYRRLQGSYIKKYDLNKLLDEIKGAFKQENKYPFSLDVGDIIQKSTRFDGEECREENRENKLDDNILPDVILWTLAQDRIANSRIQDDFKIGYNRANRLQNRMMELHLIERLHGNIGWKVIPKCIDDITSEAKELLVSHETSDASVTKALSQRPRNVEP